MINFLSNKTTEMDNMFKGIQKDIDFHLKNLIGQFLKQIEEFQKEFETNKKMIDERYCLNI